MRNRWIGVLIAACLLGAGSFVTIAQQSGGAFVPTFNYNIAGFWNFTHPCTGAGNVVGSNNCGAFQINGTSVYEVSTVGVVTLDGSNPTSVVMHPLTTIDGCTLTLQGSAINGSGLDPTAVTAVTKGTAGQLDIYAWKPTSNSNPTLIASTATDTAVQYTCAGR